MRISGSAYQPFTIGFDASTGTAASAHSPLINKVLKLRFMLLRLLSVVAAQFDTHRRRLQVRREGRLPRRSRPGVVDAQIPQELDRHAEVAPAPRTDVRATQVFGVVPAKRARLLIGKGVDRGRYMKVCDKDI